jgi:uncharacterized protein
MVSRDAQRSAEDRDGARITPPGSPFARGGELLLLIGASVRAAAWSVYSSGLARPWCLDLFADADLRQKCVTHAIPGSAYPHGFLASARQAPPGPWLFTGALENHPALIDALANERPLWGNAGDALRKVRSPALVAEVLRRDDLPALEIADQAPPGSNKSWLVKPRHSAGGDHIRFWQGRPISRSCYCQEWIEGAPCSALFCGRRDNSAAFLGATRQLIGVWWLRAKPFRYCGNIGPLPLSALLMNTLARIGNALTHAFSLRGFFGVDFVSRQEVPWLVEVNPRVTAGLEVLERAAGRSFFPYHRAVFSPSSAASEAPFMSPSAVCGKAILFAKAPLTFPADGPWLPSGGQPWAINDNAEFADIPVPFTRIEKGQPVLTLLARSTGAAECLDVLRIKAIGLERWLFR